MIGKNQLGKLFLIFQPTVWLGIMFGACTSAKHTLPGVQYIEPNNKTATALATVVGDVPLAFSDHILPFDQKGTLIGEAAPLIQLDQVVKNLTAVLRSAGTNLSGLVRVNLYLDDNALHDQVLYRMADLLPEGSHPAVTVISGGQPRPGVLVSMDAVAVVPEKDVTGGANLFWVEDAYAAGNRAQLAVLPPGRKVFVSGQAEEGKDLSEATINTMRNLFATLAYIGADARDVVQIKAFINPIEEARNIEEDIAAFFREGQVPPIVSVEWLLADNRAEIELIASAPPEKDPKEAVRFYAPNWMPQATTYSRLVDIHRGGLFFTSGLHGTGEGEEQAKGIFNTLSRILEEAGSDYDHLVKATYYPSEEKGREGLIKVRTEFYNPQRPPAASLIRVKGTGRPGTALIVDMIGVVPE
ncbi:MAG TPA: RidA family protein [Cyclobacteriaceae bacterium]|nr:RidA family protein [Cyclobacteriaceae bacterium]